VKILITGNSGYIGSHLTNFLNKEHEVFGLDLTDPTVPVIKHWLCDIRNTNYCPDQFDCVIHLAALVKVGESLLIPSQYYSTNINGTAAVLSWIKTKNFIFASTGTAQDCINPYGISKRAAETLVEEHCKNNNIPFTIFRFYNVIGSSMKRPTNPDGLFYNLIEAANTGKFYIYGMDYDTKDGTAIRDYLHVDEVCNSIKVALDNPANKVENLGHGQGHTVLEMVKTFKKVNEVDFQVHVLERRKGDLESSVLRNPSKYMQKIYNLEQMLKVYQ